jgi:PcfJ-like protein
MKKPLYARREAAAQERYLKTHACELAIKAHNQRTKSAFHVLRDLLRRGVEPSELTRDEYKSREIGLVYEIIGQSRVAPMQTSIPFLKLLIRKNPALLRDVSNLEGIKRMIGLLPQSIRPLERWRPKGKSCGRAMGDLQRYLFARYPAPAFLERAFFSDEMRYALWYVQWAQGRSPRQFENPPIAISKGMAHVLQYAPASLSVVEALRWAQALSMGAERRQALFIAEAFQQVGPVALLGVPHEWAHDPEQSPSFFSESLIRFFIANPDLTPENYGPIADYVFAQKYDYVPETREFQVKNPGYAMKGRSANALVRRVNEWHRMLGLRNRYSSLPAMWAMAPYWGLTHQIGLGSKAKHYKIRQLNKQRELFEEGDKLNHCVASYISRCVQGYCSIWTMECWSEAAGFEKLLTIEVLSDGRVAQVRGQYNRLPTQEEQKVVNLWIGKAGLKPANF